MKNLFSLTNKTALITGSSSGMGKAIAEAMGHHGATVIVSSNEESACHEVVKDFREKGISCYAIPCDMSKSDEIQQLCKQTINKTGKIDILVNCVGIAITGSFLEINTPFAFISSTVVIVSIPAM